MNIRLLTRTRVWLFAMCIFCIFVYFMFVWLLVSRLVPTSFLFVFYLSSLLLAVMIIQRVYKRLFINEEKISIIEDSELSDEENPRMDHQSGFSHRLRLATTDRDFDSNDYETLLRLDDPQEQKFIRGAALSDINRLPTFHIPGKSKISGVDPCNESLALKMLEKQCSICLEHYEKGDVVVTIPCFHQFHQHCLSTWLQEDATCPICHTHVF